jgi:N-methylhydantoinase A
VIWYESGLDPVSTPVYDGMRMLAGSIPGPAIVEFPSTTLVLRSGHRAEVDPTGNIVVHTGGHSATPDPVTVGAQQPDRFASS